MKYKNIQERNWQKKTEPKKSNETKDLCVMRGFYLKCDLIEENLVQTFNITGKTLMEIQHIEIKISETEFAC